MDKRQQIPPSQWLPNGLVKHNLPPPNALIHCNSVLDIGVGIRPMNWYTPQTYECVEPHIAYGKKLIECGYTTYIAEAEPHLRNMVRGAHKVEAIYMLDMIEHVEKDAGRRVVDLAMQVATKQVVIYTPKGFLPQEGDGFNMGGDYWQKHRSGWLPEEFPGWKTELYGRGFFAIWNK